MKIKLDENLSVYLKAPLEKSDFDVKTTADEGLLGKSDVDVGAEAKKEGRMIFTLDIEFADLRKFTPGSHPGVILFRPASMGPMAVNQFIFNSKENKTKGPDNLSPDPFSL